MCVRIEFTMVVDVRNGSVSLHDELVRVNDHKL